MKKIFDDSVIIERFSITNPFTQVIGRQEYQERCQQLAKFFDPKTAKHLLQSIIRFSFYIEPVKQPKIESTKFAVRWSDSLNGDPRYATYETCEQIFEKLLVNVLEAAQNEDRKQFILTITKWTLISYEINIDYVQRILNGNIHTPENIDFFWDENALRTFNLRYSLCNIGDDHEEVFKRTYDKVAVKSFLTDRVLTGDHKTNREKRWECHPNSVHFALRRDCLAIEKKLITQVCNFDGFPEELKESLAALNIIEFQNEFGRCPITLDPLYYDQFKEEVLSPTHGKASFQVGHLHPLKSVEENNFTGHTADNISWVSSEGNRIQGELSLEETRELVLRIFQNYRDAGIILD